jgi:uncharacterized low-complexity protein
MMAGMPVVSRYLGTAVVTLKSLKEAYSMSKKTAMKPLAVALGAAFVTSLAGASVANAAENPFGMTELSSGYKVAAEGKCGEGKCGGEKKAKEAKCGEGKCGGNK